MGGVEGKVFHSEVVWGFLIVIQVILFYVRFRGVELFVDGGTVIDAVIVQNSYDDSDRGTIIVFFGCCFRVLDKDSNLTSMRVRCMY